MNNKMGVCAVYELLVITLVFVAIGGTASHSIRSTRPTVTTTTAVSAIQEHSRRDENDPVYAKTMNPISRLYLIRATKHQSDPIFKEISRKHFRNQKNHIIRHEFQYEVKVDDKSASAWGQTKKDAKRKAAITMLKAMNLQVDIGDV